MCIVFNLIQFLVHPQLFGRSARCHGLLIKIAMIQLKPFKNDEKCFLLNLQALFLLKIFKFFPDFFGHVGKRLDKKTNVNFKAYDLIYWKTNNYNTHAQEVKTIRQ